MMARMVENRDAIFSIALSAAVLVTIVGPYASGMANSSELNQALRSFSEDLFLATMAVSVAVVGIVVSTVAVLFAVADQDDLAQMRRDSATDFDSYVGVFELPSKLAVVAFVAAIVVRGWSLTFASNNSLQLVGLAPLLVLFVYQGAATYEALLQIFGAIRTVAKHPKPVLPPPHLADATENDSQSVSRLGDERSAQAIDARRESP